MNHIGNLNGTTAEARGTWFLLLDTSGNRISGAAAAITVRVRSAGVTALGTGTITEPDVTYAPGLYLYDPAVEERVPSQGLLLVSHADQFQPTVLWPFVLVDGDVTEAAATEEGVALATQDRLSTDFAALGTQVASAVTTDALYTAIEPLATTNSVGLAVAPVQAVTDALSLTDGAVLASLTPAERVATATALWNLAGAIDGLSPVESFRVLMAFYFGAGTGLDTAAPTFAAIDGSKVRITGALTESARTVTLDVL